jgi:hypothetical protein
MAAGGCGFQSRPFRLPRGIRHAEDPHEDSVVCARPGVLHIEARPIDGQPGDVIGEASAAYSHSDSAPYVLPSSISVPRLGCFEIVGALGDVRLDWVFSPRARETGAGCRENSPSQKDEGGGSTGRGRPFESLRGWSSGHRAPSMAEDRLTARSRQAGQRMQRRSSSHVPIISR